VGYFNQDGFHRCKYINYLTPRLVQNLLGMWPWIENLSELGQVVQCEAFRFGRSSTAKALFGKDVSVTLICSRGSKECAERARIKYVIVARVERRILGGAIEYNFLARPLKSNNQVDEDTEPIHFSLCPIPDSNRGGHLDIDTNNLKIVGSLVSRQ